MHTSNVTLSARWEAEWRYIIIHPVCLIFFFEKKKGRKTNLFTKFDTNLYPSSPFFFFFTVVSGRPLRSYTPCNQVYKRGQQNACTHWSTTACDVIRHPKTTLARWPILPTKFICLVCRFVLCRQYAILFWPKVSFILFFLHSLSICLSGFFWLILAVFFFFLVFDNWWASAFFDGCKNDPLSWKHFTLKLKTFLPAAIFCYFTVTLQLGPEFEIEKRI